MSTQKNNTNKSNTKKSSTNKSNTNKSNTNKSKKSSTNNANSTLYVNEDYNKLVKSEDRLVKYFMDKYVESLFMPYKKIKTPFLELWNI